MGESLTFLSRLETNLLSIRKEKDGPIWNIKKSETQR